MVWVNREPAGPLQPRSPELLPPLELLGDAAEVVRELVAAAEGEAHLPYYILETTQPAGGQRAAERAGTPFRSKAM